MYKYIIGLIVGKIQLNQFFYLLKLMMKIYLIRHGKSDAHEAGKRQAPHSPLGKIGRKQAKKVAQRIAKEDVEILISSPWKRAHETAQAISEKLKTDIILNDLIHEKKHHPDLYESEMDSKINMDYQSEAEKNIFDFDWKFKGEGESSRDMFKRAIEFRNQLTKEYKGKNLVVVTHSLFIRAFIISALFDSIFDDNLLVFHKLYKSVSLENTGVTLLEYDEEKNEWKIEYMNDHSHLK